MAAPAFGTAGTQLQGTASTMNVDVPSSVVANDIIVVTAFVDSTATVTGLATDFAQAPDSPVVVSTGQSGQHRLYVMWKRATGSEDTAGTYNFTLSGSIYRNAQAIRYTGAVTSGDPWDVTNSAESGASAVTTTPAVSDSTTVADTLLVFAGTNWSGGLWTAPTGFTERRDSGDRVVTVADKAQAASGATGSITATCAGTGHSGAWLGALKSPSTGVTGTVAETQDNQTATATGWVTVTGTVAETQDNQTSTGTGVLGYTGSVGETQADQISTATGTLGYSGTAAETQDNQTSSASGTVGGAGEVTGTLAETQADQTSTASGVLGYGGTVSVTQAGQTATATGWITITGTLAQTQASQSSAATGTLGYTGTAAVGQAGQIPTAAGWITVTGLVATTQANQVPDAAGFVGEIPDIPDTLTLAAVPAGLPLVAVDPLRTLAAIPAAMPLTAVDAPHTLEALED